MQLSGKETEVLRVHFCSFPALPTSTSLHMKKNCNTKYFILTSDFKHKGGGDLSYCWRNRFYQAPLPGSIPLGSLCHLNSRCCVPQPWPHWCWQPWQKGGDGNVPACVHSLLPEQGEGKASALVEAATQVAGSGAGGDVCGEEVSTPKRTESENQPFSSSHQTLCCAFGAAAPCSSEEPLPSRGSAAAAPDHLLRSEKPAAVVGKLCLLSL